MKKYNHNFIYEMSFKQNSLFSQTRVFEIKEKNIYSRIRKIIEIETHTKLEEKIKTIKKWNVRRNEKNEELYSKLVSVRGLIKNMINFKM